MKFDQARSAIDTKRKFTKCSPTAATCPKRFYEEIWPMTAMSVVAVGHLEIRSTRSGARSGLSEMSAFRKVVS